MSSPTRGAEPQPMPEHQVQALYLYNFTKYVAWPQDAFAANDAPFVIGLISSDEIGRDLQDITQGKTVDGRPIVVRRISSEAGIKDCHLLFIGSQVGKDVAPILEAIRKRPILTVGVSEDFLNLGGMIRLARRDNKMRLAINLDAGRSAKLSVSAKLMAVAERVHGKSELPRN